MNKPVYLVLSILDLSKTVVYEFCCDYVEQKYGKNAKLIWIQIDIWIEIASLFMQKQMIFTKILQKIMKQI